MGGIQMGTMTICSPRERRRCAAVLLLPRLDACATGDAGREIRQLAPAALCVLVDAAPHGAAAAADPQSNPVRAEWVPMIVNELRRLDASSRVVTRTEL